MSLESWEAHVLNSPGATARVEAIEVEFRQTVAEPSGGVEKGPSD
jgi:hypothetical protein